MTGPDLVAPASVPTGPDPTASADDTSLVRGARWLTLATFAVGGINYAYALLLTRLLDPGPYARFAAGQALLLTAGTVAVASVPWVLAQELGRPGATEQDRQRAVWFATVTNVAQGVVGALVVLALARSFAGWSTSAVVAVSALLVFVGSTTGGWLQGRRRFGALAALRVAEVVVKAAGGAALVLLGASVGGALAGFALGALVVVAAGAWLLRGDLRPRPGALSSRRLWRSAAGVAGIQGLVSVLASLDVVLVAALPVADTPAASYQASMVLARVPLFLAGAVAAVAFPLFAGGSGAPLVRTAVRLYLVVALPLALALALVPGAVLAPLFPASFSDLPRLLPWTAASGLLIGLVELLTTFFQASVSYARCLRRQAAGLAVAAVAVPSGWLLGGVVGLAAGALLGAATTAVLLLAECRRTWPGSLGLGPRPAAAALGVAALLAALRPLPAVWLVVAAGMLGACAYQVFLRPERATTAATGGSR